MGTAEHTRLTGLDALMVRFDRGSAYNHTLKIAILDPSTDPDGWSFPRCRRLLEHNVAKVPMMRKRYLPTPLGLHQPVWVDDPHFELDTHVRRVCCPPPGGMVEFCALVEQVYSHPLDHDRPLWQVWVVEGLEGGRVALLTLLHHAYSDGAGVVDILEGLASTQPKDASSTGVPDWEPAPLPSAPRRLMWAARELPPLLKKVSPALKALRERRRLEQRFAAEGSMDRPSGPDLRTPQPFGGCLTRSRRVACESFALAEFREVRAALGGTLNDVFLSCVSGAVRQFLVARGVECQSPVIGGMTFLRPGAERPLQGGGNFSSIDDVWLHPEISDPAQRLAAMGTSAKATKDHFKAVADADPLLLVDLIPGGVVTGLLRLNERTEGRFSPGRNIITSNVAGPREPRFFARWRMEHWFSTGQLMQGGTLSFTAWSYAGQFNLGVLSGSPRVSDPWELMAGFRNALEDLLTVARRSAAYHSATADRDRV